MANAKSLAKTITKVATTVSQAVGVPFPGADQAIDVVSGLIGGATNDQKEHQKQQESHNLLSQLAEAFKDQGPSITLNIESCDHKRSKQSECYYCDPEVQKKNEITKF